MRRKDRAITDEVKIDEIIRRCVCARLGFSDGEKVYIVPLNFGYVRQEDRRTFYFHGAKEGRKVDLMRKTHAAGFELDTNYKLREGETACGHSAGFQSVIGTGRTEIIKEPDEKRNALQAIMFQNTGRKDWDFPGDTFEKVCVFKLEVDELSCKEHL